MAFALNGGKLPHIQRHEKKNLVSQWPKFILKITIAWHNMKRSFDQRKNINQSCKMGEDWRTVFPLNYWYVLGVEAKLHDWAERPVSSALASRSEKEPSRETRTEQAKALASYCCIVEFHVTKRSFVSDYLAQKHLHLRAMM